MKAGFILIPESEVSTLGVLRQKAWVSTYRGIYPDEMIDQFDYDWHREKDLIRLRNPHYQNWFIVDDREKIGYLTIRRGKNMFLQSLYLLPLAQKMELEGRHLILSVSIAWIIASRYFAAVASLITIMPLAFMRKWVA